MPEPQPIYIVPPPKGKSSPWVGIIGFVRFIIIGLAGLGALRLLALLIEWMT